MIYKEYHGGIGLAVWCDDLVELIEGTAAVDDVTDHLEISECHRFIFYHKVRKGIITEVTKLTGQSFDTIFELRNIKVKKKS